MNNKSYFLHCPKTGGRYLEANTIDYFRKDLAIKGIMPSRHLIYGHKSWQPVIENPNIFIFSLFRNPIKRIVSHYVYFYTDHNKELCNKEKMFEALEKNDNRSKKILNYQSQFILSDSESFYGFPHDPIDINKEKLIQRVSRIDLPIRTEDLSESKCKYVLSKMYDIAGIKSPDIELLPHVIKKEHSSELSKNLYQSLTTKEKEILLLMNQYDSEIYESIKSKI